MVLRGGGGMGDGVIGIGMKRTGRKGRNGKREKRQAREVTDGDMIMINYLPWVLFRLEEDGGNDVRNDRICANVMI